MSNNSATGGYLAPSTLTPQPALPGAMSLEDFLQTLIVGISGIDGSMVRPKWQLNPPKSPDATDNWIALALQDVDADFNPYNQALDDGTNVFQRNTAMVLQCSFYGPLSLEIGEVVRDGLQIPQNLEALELVDMGLVSTSKLVRAPDLVEQRWVNRWEMSIQLNRQINRVYPILTFLSASGTLHALQSNVVKNIALTGKA